ncbi:hypothetical protein [Sphingomonas sp. Leaf343]|uniref:hypothetical protein n=1 Tax=Sphingomonas sp. Leaf343 TaxID=1736345 RepID=UPI000B31EC5F|nr:hypothetical protein [Sphingomonas sp. Leaf343]
MKFLIPIAAPLLLGACAATPAETARATAVAQGDANRLAKVLAGFVPGRKTTCIPSMRSSRTEVYGPTLIVRDSVGSSPVYVADTGGGCERAARGDIIVTVRSLGQMCSGDIIQTRDQNQGFFTGSCSPGEFTEYRKAK